MDTERSGRSERDASAGVSRRAALRRLGGGGIVATTLMGAAPRSADAQAADGSEAAARRAIDAINQALASGDTSDIDAAFTADFVDHTPRRSPTTGRLYPSDLAGLKASLLDLHSVFPDAAFVVEDVIAAGDKAAVRFTFRGTPDPAAPGVPEAVERGVSAGGVMLGRVAGGRIAESWDYDELAELYGPLVEAADEETPTPAPGGGVVSESRDVRGFDEVALQGVGTLIIEQGDTESLTIEAEARILPKIATEVRGGRLEIRPDRSFRTDEPITYFLTAKALTAIELAGAGRVEATQFTTDELRLGVSGTGAVTLDGLTADALDVTASGSAKLELAGQVDRQDIELTGASEYHAADLASRATTITVDGASRATVRVSEALEARVGGAGSIEYIGSPTVSQDVTGAGRVTKAG